MVRKVLIVCAFVCPFFLSKAQDSAVAPYQLPDIPDSLTTPDVRSEYLIEHYWDNFAVADRAYLEAPLVVEQAFVDFTSIMRITSRESTMKASAILLKWASSNGDVLLM